MRVNPLTRNPSGNIAGGATSVHSVNRATLTGSCSPGRGRTPSITQGTVRRADHPFRLCSTSNVGPPAPSGNRCDPSERHSNWSRLSAPRAIATTMRSSPSLRPSHLTETLNSSSVQRAKTRVRPPGPVQTRSRGIHHVARSPALRVLEAGQLGTLAAVPDMLRNFHPDKLAQQRGFAPRGPNVFPVQFNFHFTGQSTSLVAPTLTYPLSPFLKEGGNCHRSTYSWLCSPSPRGRGGRGERWR